MKRNLKGVINLILTMLFIGIVGMFLYFNSINKNSFIGVWKSNELNTTYKITKNKQEEYFITNLYGDTIISNGTLKKEKEIFYITSPNGNKVEIKIVSKDSIKIKNKNKESIFLKNKTKVSKLN